MKYIKIHKSKFIKFFIVILVSVFGFFGVNIMVNADSVWPFGDVNTDNGDYPGNYLMTSHFNWDSFYFSFEMAGIEAVTGGNDTLVWFGDESGTVTDYWKFSNSNIIIDGEVWPFEGPRTIVLNEQKSNDNLLCYNCLMENLAYIDYFVFEKKDFFMRLNDLYSYYVPSVKFPEANVNVFMEIEGYILDKDGTPHDLHLVSPNKRVTHNSQFYLYPTKSELFGNIDFDEVYSSNAIMYISNYRCRIEFSDLSINTFNYYYSVQSVEDYNTRYGTILSDYVNAVSSSDIVGGVADNVNSFLQIEILPGLSFFGILLLAIAVPMLIWILKIFFGG